MEKLKILIADDHEIIRSALIALLAVENNHLEIYEASNRRELIEKVEKGSFDVILMDIGMPVINGIEATEIIMQKYPDSKILVFSANEREREVKKMLELGALGYVLKDDSPYELFEAIKNVATGEKYLSRNVSNTLLENMLFKKGNSSGIEEPLSEREIEVLKLIGDGLTNKEIGDKLYISDRTVDSHRRNLLQKTGAKNSAELVKYAFTKGIIDEYNKF